MSNEQNESMSLEDAFVENMNEMRKKEEYCLENKRQDKAPCSVHARRIERDSDSP